MGMLVCNRECNIKRASLSLSRFPSDSFVRLRRKGIQNLGCRDPENEHMHCSAFASSSVLHTPVDYYAFVDCVLWC